MFDKVLVANRGEIAVAIIRALKEMGIASVAIYSKVDEDSLFVQLADQAVRIGESAPKDTYLNIQEIISVATLTGCQAVHPGYGFLSENAEFAKICEEVGLKFIGPTPEMITLMGDKANAKETMKSLGVPLIPGSDGVVQSVDEAQAIANHIGYPVLLKSAAGGGGKGISVVNSEAELPALFDHVQQEAQLSYNDSEIYIEKMLTHTKHIEMQVIADEHGHAVYLPERDCSLQRNHQKVIEESPCVQVSAAKRKWLGEIVKNATLELGYTNTGTFEFLMDQDQQFYFLEMNTRIQVEHTVTEQITGLELIKEQVRVAAGLTLSVTQADIHVKQHAIECRLNAENPAFNFAPSPGRLTQLEIPAGTMGIRVDAGVITNSMISPYYDSMIAKVIVTAASRELALTKMQRVLRETMIQGVITNREFLLQVLAAPQVVSAQYLNNYLETEVLRGDQDDD